MPMTLYCTRAKCFIDSEEGTKKFLLQSGPSPQPVPFWVANTPTFKQGIKDKSIINLTPPDQMPGYKHPKTAVMEEVEEPVEPTEDDDPTGDKAYGNGSEEDVEQKEVPKAAFGGQPMTPVAPAPKVGGITGNAKKR